MEGRGLQDRGARCQPPPRVRACPCLPGQKSPPAPWLLPWGQQHVAPLPQAPRCGIWTRWCRGVPRGSGFPPPPHPSPSLHNSERDKAEVLKVLSAAIYTASGKVWQALSWFPEMKTQTSLPAAHSQNLPPPGPRIVQCCPFTPNLPSWSSPWSTASIHGDIAKPLRATSTSSAAPAPGLGNDRAHYCWVLNSISPFLVQLDTHRA